MYTIHTTPGFIIESRPSGEAGKILSIFTRDLGLVWAAAQGIRLEKSKLRYHSQEYSFGEFSFVRGKEFWRLTSTNENLPRVDLGVMRGGQELIARIALLLRRLLHGEEAHPELFECLQSFIDFVQGPTLDKEQAQTLESIIVFKILHLLGYIGNDKNVDQRIITERLSTELFDAVVGQRIIMNRHINKALRESHL